MRSGINAVICRALTTRHAQEDVQSSWIWNEKSLEQWDNEIVDIQRAREVCSAAKFNRNSTRAALDAKLGDMHRRTMQFLAMAKFHFRHDPSILEALSGLTACGMGRRAIAQEALDVETAWQKADPDWAATEVNTLASFQVLREQCTELESSFLASYSAWRTQSEILNQKAEALNEANIAWYAAATRIFPAGTVEGDMIRRSIPTLYSPPVPAGIPAPALQPQTEVAAP